MIETTEEKKPLLSHWVKSEVPSVAYKVRHDAHDPLSVLPPLLLSPPQAVSATGDCPSYSPDTSSLLPPWGLDTYCSCWWESFPPDIFMPNSLISWRSLLRCLLIKRLSLTHLCKRTHTSGITHPLPCFTFLCCSQHHLSFNRFCLFFLIFPCGRQNNPPQRCSCSNPWNVWLYCA